MQQNDIAVSRNLELNTIENVFHTRDLQEIADHISHLIDHNVVIYSHRGYIVAASNRSRIGHYHSAIQGMIDNGEEMAVVYSPDNPDKVLPGISLPISVDEQALGAIGITGDPDEIKQLTHIIRYLVQHNLAELRREVSDFEYNNEMTGLLYNWLMQSAEVFDASFLERAARLGIDLNGRRLVCVLNPCIVSEPLFTSSRFNSRIYRNIRRRLKNRQHIIASMEGDIVLLLSVPDVETGLALLTELRKDLFNDYGIWMAAGAVSRLCDSHEIRSAYEIAKLACRSSEKEGTHRLISYDMLSPELLFSAVRSDIREHFSSGLLNRFSDRNEAAECGRIIDAYVDASCSVAAASEALHMHKNTLQYRLNKIRTVTGLNPRVFKELMMLYISFHL